MTSGHVARTLELRKDPGLKPVLYQDWTGLTFLHWEVDGRELAGKLPDGVSLDLWDGKAYLGVVPFTMQNIRPRGLPCVPGLSNFHETNVRAYVTGPDGSPGVWFLSLDASNRTGCWLGRTFFGLNYRFSQMEYRAGGQTEYRSRRAGAENHVVSRAHGEEREAQPGTFEFFLVERYLLFSEVRGRLVKGLVHHAPYLVQPAECLVCETSLPISNGVRAEGPPVSCLYSPGVRTKVYRVEPV